MQTQNEMVLEYLETKGPLTQQEALLRLSCMRLPARICELRQAGHIIDKDMCEAVNQFGRRVRFAEYRLIKRSGV